MAAPAADAAAAAAERRGSSALASSSGRLEDVNEEAFEFQLRDLAGSVFRDAAVPSARRMRDVALPGSDWEWATDWEVTPLSSPALLGGLQVPRQSHPFSFLRHLG